MFWTRTETLYQSRRRGSHHFVLGVAPPDTERRNSLNLGVGNRECLSLADSCSFRGWLEAGSNLLKVISRLTAKHSSPASPAGFTLKKMSDLVEISATALPGLYWEQPRASVHSSPLCLLMCDSTRRSQDSQTDRNCGVLFSLHQPLLPQRFVLNVSLPVAPYPIFSAIAMKMASSSGDSSLASRRRNTMLAFTPAS